MSQDLGLQAERTLLAWRRTALGLLTNAALLLGTGRHEGLRPVAGIVMSVLALGCWAAAGAAFRGAIRPQALGSVTTIRLVTGLVIAVGLADGYLVLTE